MGYVKNITWNIDLDNNQNKKCPNHCFEMQYHHIDNLFSFHVFQFIKKKLSIR